jgi:UDP-N-acetylmuramoyl-L-alanyl-D-glutamate--2,6-diaminopimelate ligase
MSPGWPHDPVGDGGARLMVTAPTCRGTELGLQVYWASLCPGNESTSRPFYPVMKLNQLAAALPGATLIGDADVDIRAVENDSRRLSAGALFVAVPGFRADGHDFLREALAAGAAALLVQEDRRHSWAEVEAPRLVVPDTRSALALAAAALHDWPARKLTVIGVTGTDGKTSLSHLIAHMLEAAGESVGLMTTAENRADGRPLADSGRFTTPEAPEVQALLAEIVAEGCRYAVLEATSHGLALHRLDACEFDIAVMTNLGRDHIDFHPTREDYLAAKGRLFQMLDEAVDKGLHKTAVLNADDPASEYFRSLTRARAVTYGLASQADVTAAHLTPDGWGTRFALRSPTGEANVRLARPGPFNVANALAATATALALGLELAATVPGLESWPGAPGRMEALDQGQPFRVVVDFAHAPESLARILTELRSGGRGRLIALFGCIGERDFDRRHAMGRVAAELADYTYLTDDNPYSEDRNAILAEIARGLRDSGKKEGHDFAVVPDRRQAIAQALAMAVDDDTVLLAGKGHERQVHLADASYDCDDREVARRVLAELFPIRP